MPLSSASGGKTSELKRCRGDAGASFREDPWGVYRGDGALPPWERSKG